MVKTPIPIRIAVIAALAVIFIGGARIAVAAADIEDLPSLLWAPTGIGLAAVIIFGPGVAIGIALGAVVSIMEISHGHVMAAVTVAFVDTAEAVGAYYALRALQFRPALERVRDVLALVLVALVVTLTSATLSVTVLYLSNALNYLPLTVWSWWWMSHLTGDLIVAPLFLTWVFGTRERMVVRKARIAEGFALGVSVIVVGMCVFGGWFPHWLPGAQMPHYLFPLLLWAGLRFGPRGAAITNTAICVLAILGIALHQGPFHDAASFQSFISVSAIATLALSAMHVEVSRAIRRKGAIQQAALDAIVTIDSHDRIIEFNPAAERLFVISEHEVLGRDVKPLFVPRGLRSHLRDGLASYLRKRGDSLIGQRVHCPAQRANGTEFPAEIGIMWNPIDGEDLYSASIRDISVELQAEYARREAQQVLEATVRERTKELQRSEQILAYAQALSHLGSFDFDIKTGALEWSEEMFRLYGREPATFTPTYQGFLAAVLPADRTAVSQTIKRAITEHSSFDFEERIVRPDGTLRILQSQGTIQLGDDGQPARILGCCQDITERKHAESERYRLVDLVESSQDAIIGLSTDGVIETWNAAAERMFGYSAVEIVGTHATVLVPPEVQSVLEAIITSVRTGQHHNNYELVHRRRDGTTFDGSVTMSAILDHDQHVIGISKVLRDTTEQKRARDLLQESLREKEVLLREIHHRVKNNLQVISSFLNLQVASVTSSDARKGLLESQSRIQSMALLHQLLYQSKDLARIDLGDYLRALVTYLRTTYDGDSNRIMATVDAPPVRLDLDRAIPCGLIVNELVTNSLRHAFPEGRTGRVAVQIMQPEPDRLVLEVRDDGIGIPANISPSRGPSFGLQIAHLLAQQLEGTLEIIRDRGTTVRISFPLEHRRDSATDIPRAAAAP